MKQESTVIRALELRRHRQIRAKERLKKQLSSGVKTNEEGESVPLLVNDRDRIKKEISILEDKLSGKKKGTVTKKDGTIVVEQPKERWFIDIYTVHLGYVKNSERKKNKGKSRKKMRKVKSKSFVRSVLMQPGMMQAFREGRMGVSPKTHSFSARKEEPQFIK